jgi:hypothetical protein
METRSHKKASLDGTTSPPPPSAQRWSDLSEFPQYYFVRCARRSILMRDLVRCLDEGNVVTFDDGFKCVLDVAPEAYSDPNITCARFLEITKMRIDRSRTSGDTVCPVSLEKYTDPVIFNADYRTYNRAVLLQMIESTLVKGKTLRLMDCVIDPFQIGYVFAMPNRSLGALETTPEIPDINFLFHASIPYPQPELMRDHEGLCDAWDRGYRIVDDPADGKHLDYTRALDIYKDVTGDTNVNAYGPVVRNAVLQHLVFPRGPSKHKILTFYNTKFVNCVVVISEHLGVINYVACDFENVEILVLAPRKVWVHEIFTTCSFCKCTMTDVLDLEQRRNFLVSPITVARIPHPSAEEIRILPYKDLRKKIKDKQQMLMLEYVRTALGPID